MGVERTKLSLKKGQVDIWLVSSRAVSERLLCRYEKLLDVSELLRLRRFVSGETRLQYIIARVLVRTTLSSYVDVPVGSWRFYDNRYGRPYIDEPSRFRDIIFSVSHTLGLVVCAVTKGSEIGVDVENIRCDLEFNKMAQAVFSPTERAALFQCAPEMRAHTFFSLWTLKEAYIKARGMGLSLPLEGFWMDLVHPVPRIHFSDLFPDDSERWRFRQFSPTPHHKLALAITMNGEPNVTLRWVTPLAD